MEGVQGSFYFHPSDKDPSLGPLEKKLLKLVLPVYSNSETA